MIEFRTKKPELTLDFANSGGRVTFTTDKVKLEPLSQLKDKDYIVTIKEYHEKRSLNANAYFWVLVGQIAIQLKTSTDEVYLSLLRDYGVFTFLIVKPNVVDRVKSEWRTVDDLGTVTINGAKGVQLKCFFGSSTYNKAEMTRLIEGAVNEAKALGIDTRTPEEIALMTEEWVNEKHNAK